MRKGQRFHVIAVLLGLAALMLFQIYVQAERVLQMPYSDFKKARRDGRVTGVTLAGHLLRGTVRVADAQAQEKAPCIIFVDGTETRVREILTKRDGDLKAIARRLLDKEVLEGEELHALLHDRRPAGEGAGAGPEVHGHARGAGQDPDQAGADHRGAARASRRAG